MSERIEPLLDPWREQEVEWALAVAERRVPAPSIRTALRALDALAAEVRRLRESSDAE